MNQLIEKITGRIPWKFKRSSQWKKVRDNFLFFNNYCAVCGTEKKLNVHHIIPVHIQPENELWPLNLITLCEGKDGGCHFRWGHLWNWQSFNRDVQFDAKVWSNKKKGRP